MGSVFHSIFAKRKKELPPFSAKNSASKTQGEFFCCKDSSSFTPLARRDFLKRALIAAAGAAFFPAKASALSIGGIEYVPMSKLAGTFGMKYKTVEPKKRQSIFNKNISVDFTVHRRDIILAGRKIWLGFPPAEAGGELQIAARDIDKTLKPILTPSTRTKIVPLYHIVIDPGHGGKDHGAINRAFNLNEKTIALDISNKLATILKTKGYKVTLTRTTDTFVDLKTRGALANKWGGQMFLSIHCNAASPNVSGIETFAMTPMGQPSTTASKLSSSDSNGFAGNANDDWNTLLAFYVQSELLRATNANDRGVKRARFAVLVNVTMPAVLIETGFISNPAEARKLATNDHRQLLANAICSGVLRYQGAIDRLRGK